MTPAPMPPTAPILVPPDGRVLIIKPSAIGDVVHGLPILNLLRRTYPRAKIDWLVTPACAGILDGHPQLNDVVLFDRKRLGASWRDRGARRELAGLGERLSDARYDVVLDLQGLFRSGWMAWKTGAAVRVGFRKARELAPAFYTHRVDVGPPEQHAIERYLSLAQAVGCPRGPVEYVFPHDNADKIHSHTLVPPGVKFAVLLPGTNWQTKRWPVEHFAALVKPLEDRFGLKTVVAGGAYEASVAPRIAGAYDASNRTTLRQLVALLERASLVIANDSGPMHIATALGRPLVTMFGPTNPVRTGPFERMESVVRVGLPCSPCYAKHCSHVSCLTWLYPEMVLARVAKELGR